MSEGSVVGDRSRETDLAAVALVGADHEGVMNGAFKGATWKTGRPVGMPAKESMHEIGIDPIAIRADFNVCARRPGWGRYSVEFCQHCAQLCRACLILAFMVCTSIAPGTSSSPITKAGVPVTPSLSASS